MFRVFCESVNIPPPNLRERSAQLSRIIFVGSFFGLAVASSLLFRCAANLQMELFFFFFWSPLQLVRIVGIFLKRLDFFDFAEERNSKNDYNDEWKESVTMNSD